jgi:hypothetical protein
MSHDLNDCGECRDCNLLGIGHVCLVKQALGGQNQEEKLCRMVVRMFRSPSFMEKKEVVTTKIKNVFAILKTNDIVTLKAVECTLDEDDQRKKIEKEVAEAKKFLFDKKTALTSLNKPYLITVTEEGYVVQVAVLNDNEIYEWMKLLNVKVTKCYPDLDNGALIVETQYVPEDFICILEETAKPGWLAAISEGAAKKRKKAE